MKMRREAMLAIALAVVALVLAVYCIVSYDWYEEERTSSLEEGNLVTDIGYGLRGVQNVSQSRLNGTVLQERESHQTYDEFIGVEGTRAQSAADAMFLIVLVAIVFIVLFIPLVFLAHQGRFDDLVGKLGQYIPLMVAQVAALLLILGAMWFSYAFTEGLDKDVEDLGQERYRAVGGMGGWYAIFAGIIIQAAAVMALSRTRLVYIEPLEEGKTPEPVE